MNKVFGYYNNLLTGLFHVYRVENGYNKTIVRMTTKEEAKSLKEGLERQAKLHPELSDAELVDAYFKSLVF